MLGMFWTNCAIEGKSPWFERVTSDANLSNEISRNNVNIVIQSGWHLIDLELKATYEILIRAAKDIVFAHGEAASLITNSSRTQVKKQLTTCPWGHDAMTD